MNRERARRGLFEFGWDRVMSLAVSLAGLLVALWTGYWIVWLAIVAAYFVGGFSFEWWLENVDRADFLYDERGKE